MNGEMYQMCNIVVSVKQALKNNTVFIFEPAAYEKSLVFHMMSAACCKVDTIEKWFEECCKKGIVDIKFLTPVKMDEWNLDIFANAHSNLLLCYYANGLVTYFQADWKFCEYEEGWDITYTEYVWKNPSQDKPKFHDNTKPFIKILEQIETLALQLEVDNFASLFRKAILAAKGEILAESKVSIQLPDQNKRLFLAASAASVFGGMGSWNDLPLCIAHEMNLVKEYEQLTSALRDQLTLAILYAVNEW